MTAFFPQPARRVQLAWLAVLLLGLSRVRAVDYEVYPGAAYYMTQMVSSISFPYTAQFANGFYYNSWAFGDNSDTVLSTQQKQAICNNFSNRFAMIEDNQGSDGPNICITDINTMRGLGMKPIATFINQPADPFVWRQTVANNGALQTPSYEMLPPWWVGQGSGWSGWTKQQTNMLVWGCCGSGVDSPVNLYFSGNGISASAYQKAVWDQCKWSHAVGKKFNYLASPNTDKGEQFLIDMQRVTRSLEDNGAEPDVYGVELYGIRPVDLVPETTTNNGVVQANWTITGLAYYLLKHRDGDPGTLGLYATSNGVNYGQSVISPILTNSDQSIPFNPAQTNQFTLTLTNLSAWLDYTAVLRARTAQAANWNISFKLGATDITSSVLNKSGYVFLSSKRLLPNTAQQVTVILSPKVIGAPAPLDLVIEALPHAGVDQAMDVIAFQYQTNQSPPTLNFPTNDWFTLQGMGIAPIWFTVGDAETISTQLTVTAVSGNTTLLPNNKIVFGQSGIQRWVTLSPVSSQWGSAPVTLIVSDGQFSVSNTFNVFVQQTNTIPYVKANNTANLELTNSWVTNTVPDEFGVAVWDSTVTTANTTTLGDDMGWAGIQIKNPGGAVTINGTNKLSLGDAGVNMGAASQNFTMNCQAVLGADVNCSIASGRIATLNGVLSSLGSISKSGAGLLVLSGSNTFSGGTSISPTSGSKNPLLASNSLALGTGTVTIGNGGNNDAACLELAGGITVANNLGSWLSRNTAAPNILNVNGTNTVTHSISAGNGGGQSTLESDSGDLVMTGSITTRQLNLQGAGNGELRGVVDTSGYNLVKTGTGTWTLSANNIYSGGTLINGGTLAIKGKHTGTGAVTVNAGGTLAGSGTIPGAVSVPSGGSLAPGAVATSAGTILTISNSLTLLSGSTNSFKLNAFAKTNDSVRGLSSVKYGGTLVVTNLAGTLTTNNAFKLFYAASYSGTFASLSPANPDVGLYWDTSTLASDGTLRITGISAVTIPAGGSYLDVNGTSAGFGNTNGSVTESGNYWTTDVTGVSAPGAFALTNAMKIGNIASDFNGSTLILTNDVSASITGAGFYIVGTNVDLTLAGTVNAHWNNPFTWFVAAGSTLHVTVSVGSNHGWNFNREACTLSGGGVFDFISAFAANGGVTTENMTGSGTVLLEQTTTSNFGATNSNQPTLSAGFTLANGNLDFASPQSLADTFQAFAGPTNIFTINGGTLDNLTGAAGTINLGNGAYTIGDDFTFAGSSSLSLGNNPVIVSNGTPTITVNSNTLTIGGPITTAFGLAKNGGGTLALSGLATLPQGIQVYEGTLLANGIIGPANSTGIIVNGGVLGGTGTLLSTVTVQPNAMLTPGVNGISTLTISNNLTCQSGSMCWFEINAGTATNDLVCGLQTVTFGGTLVVTNLAGTLAAGISFKLFDATNYAGGFDSMVLPDLGVGLYWDTSTLTSDGTLRITGTPTVTIPAGGSYLDVNGTSAGFGDTNGSVTESGNYWTTDVTGVAVPAAFALTNVMKIGNVASDFNGDSITLTTDVPAKISGAGLYIVSTNVDLTMTGSINTYWNNPFTWYVAAGATLHIANTQNNHGWNFNREACTLTGGGVFDFVSTFAANGGLVTENMADSGTVLLEQTNTSNFGAPNGNQPALSAGFTLANGNFYFVSPQSLSDTFQAFAGPTNIFTINGGTLDNLTGAAGTVNLGNGAYTISGDFNFAGSSSLSLGNNPVIVSNGTPTITVSSNTLTIGGSLTAAFGLAKNGGGTLALTSSATLPQGIQVYEGTLLANGIIGPANGTGIFVNGGVLGGTGTLLGAVTIQPNGTLTPGVNGISTLTISNNLTCRSGSTSWFEINAAMATNDLVCGLQTVTFGGTLVVTDLAGTLAAGNSFKLFDATNYAGAFDSMVLPALDASLVWSNRLALDGTILVVLAPPVTGPQLTQAFTSASTLQFNWTNTGLTFRLQAQTNSLTAGLGTNWFDYPGGDTPPVNVPINNTSGSVFFRLISP